MNRYADTLVDLMLVRRMQPYHVNVGKRLIKSPKHYVRDSGIVHALLNIRSLDDLLGHPVAGASREGHVVENLIGAAPRGFRTAAADVQAARSFIVHPGEETCPLGDGITAIPLPALMRRLVEAR